MLIFSSNYFPAIKLELLNKQMKKEFGIEKCCTIKDEGQCPEDQKSKPSDQTFDKQLTKLASTVGVNSMKSNKNSESNKEKMSITVKSPAEHVK